MNYVYWGLSGFRQSVPHQGEAQKLDSWSWIFFALLILHCWIFHRIFQGKILKISFVKQMNKRKKSFFLLISCILSCQNAFSCTFDRIVHCNKRVETKSEKYWYSRELKQSNFSFANVRISINFTALFFFLSFFLSFKEKRSTLLRTEAY